MKVSQSIKQTAPKTWEELIDCINIAGEPGAPLHLKLKALHADIARGESMRQSLEMGQIADMDRMLPFVVVRAAVKSPA